MQLLNLNLETGEITIIFNTFAANASWSSDGTQVAFISTRSTGRLNSNIVNIFILNTQNGEVAQVTSDDMLAHENFPNPAWSPDDTQLAFESWIDGSYEIFKINIDGTEMTQLTFDDTNDINPIWRPCP